MSRVSEPLTVSLKLPLSSLPPWSVVRSEGARLAVAEAGPSVQGRHAELAVLAQAVLAGDAVAGVLLVEALTGAAEYGVIE
jgi:hypothetical protein